MNRYPLWKYVIVLVALAIGLIYTLPNLFGESPAVQVSSAKSTVRLETNLISHVDELLKKNNIPTTGSDFEQTGPSATANPVEPSKRTSSALAIGSKLPI